MKKLILLLSLSVISTSCDVENEKIVENKTIKRKEFSLENEIAPYTEDVEVGSSNNSSGNTTLWNTSFYPYKTHFISTFFVNELNSYNIYNVNSYKSSKSINSLLDLEVMLGNNLSISTLNDYSGSYHRYRQGSNYSPTYTNINKFYKYVNAQKNTNWVGFNFKFITKDTEIYSLLVNKVKKGDIIFMDGGSGARNTMSDVFIVKSVDPSGAWNNYSRIKCIRIVAGSGYKMTNLEVINIANDYDKIFKVYRPLGVTALN